MVMPRFKGPLMGLIGILIALIGYDGVRLLGEQQFNRALSTDGNVWVEGSDEVHRQFASAYQLQQENDFKAAVKAYASINVPPSKPLHSDIKYNLANLYFREAAQMRENGADDLAMPLLELAKQNYKEILRINEHHWDAKHNLELALILAPELDAADTLEERNPEHSQRALTTIQSRKSLP